ncbi:hypothetical protein D5F52_26785 (plasmid) [Brevibacillus laterosporus]|uniref:hypothetical protein n=1 Tax=Brevibacillus laterosporus TaxID=1465 RepID=UPI000E6D316C|nr:hypothetical protein [Brevibacillus laterosporus]AYB41762.1 hypothetical protein D5F52_26785 [Brevibacillus laterosporus]MBG9790990.1 hypothetical protein [Brevibacillus laterosporus]MBG9804887.1 hypothetical protein [Brevibacillus laterosporus]MED1790532.1 hypothetical protein [Brevibacillus laterosporus]MED4762107.1 hypothetical protein [Brevibacillus laterosporus]
MIRAAFSDGDALISVFPSFEGGIHLIRIENKGRKLIVHSTVKSKAAAELIEQAVFHFKQWKSWMFMPWMPKLEVHLIAEPVILQSSWCQIF